MEHAAPPSSPTLRASGLVAGYPPARPRVLAGVSLDLSAGVVTAIIGPNGSGKTTLLRALLGLLPTSEGHVHLAGETQDVHRLPPVRRAERLAYVSQRPAVAFAYSTLEVVAMGGLMLGVGAARRHEIATHALRDVGLEDRALDPFAELSIGQQQAAAIARAIAQLRMRPAHALPPALLADEPFSAMDPARALNAMGVLRRCAEQGVAVACVLHDIALARRWADRVVVMTGAGTIAAAGAAAEVCVPDILGPVYGVRFADATLATPSGPITTLIALSATPDATGVATRRV